ncbi:MAG: VTT domain-containing protein [Gemmatimonadota bacterium]
MSLITEHLALFFITLGYGVASGFIPIFNAELYVIGGAALSGRAGTAAVVIAMTLGQMIGKVLLYYAGRGAIRMPLRQSHREKLELASERLDNSRLGTAPFLFVSAATGWPPFYVVSILAGMLRLGFWMFLTTGFLGRLIRFAVIALFPQLLVGG